MSTRAAGTRGRAGLVTAVVVAALVVLVDLVLVALWVWLLVVDDGVTRYLWGGLGLLVLWQLLPRPARVDTHAVPLAASQAPGLDALCREVAEAVGARPPDRVVVETAYPVHVQATGYLGRATLVLGLPQWTALDPGERVAVLAHELSCAQVRRGPAGTLVRLGDDLLTSARTILTPARSVTSADSTAVDQSMSSLGLLGAGDELAGNQARRGAAVAVGGAGMSVVGAPVRAVQALLARAWRPTLHRAALDADRAAAALAGTAAVRGWLLSTVGIPRGLTAAGNAARTPGADPFTAMETAARPEPAELLARLEADPAAAADPQHPPTAERLRLVEATDAPAVGRSLEWSTLSAAAADVFAARGPLTPRFRDELGHGRS
ncbi:M48 family metallopeptidase [Phycicoccus sonneratiae]|uniref:M48 family metallopeptidase n=1 Tax=Phycicoccus sonneratiae TaxID=2807628 RepID=A0ABS2CGS2_9MICO|nr:M48 family metallopeptidase [Phycicoccus sonneraticus]MBM6399015.1 M48 family metallopeptidase [Phycicoccus sonneraticus]